MPIFTVPCAECAAQKAAFESDGSYIVSGCAPNPTKAGMCDLKYEHKSTISATSQASAANVAATDTEAGAQTSPAKSKKSKASGPSSAGSGFSAVSAASGLTRHVNVNALNLRSTPSANTSLNVLRTLVLGQSVEIIGDQDNGWWPIQLTDGSARGFVKALLDAQNGIGKPSLRMPAAPAREALVAEAIRQWERFKFGQGKETVDPFYKYVGEMWSAIHAPYDGRNDIPWSAAAISFMVRHAGATHAKYMNFEFAESHSKYIHAAINANGQPDAPFHGFRLFERKPELGDLVARSREAPITFEQAKATNAFKSHTDIVVAVHADAVYTIGGNVSDSVSITRYAKTDGGFLSDANGVFALLVNNVS